MSSALGPFDSDEAVAGLMARHMLHGEFFTFYWGQPYGGTHEAVLLALLYALRVPTRAGMELVPIAISAAASLLIWRIGVRTFSRRGGALAGALFWCTSSVFVWQSTKERSFYGFTMLAGVAVLFFTLRLIDRPAPLDALLLGVAGGAGWHSSPNIVYLALPALIWLAVDTIRRRNLAILKLSWVAAAGALVGALPWIYSNVRSRGASLDVAGGWVETTYVDRLNLFAKKAFPYALGLQTPHWEIGTAAKIGYVLLLFALGVAVLRLSGRAWIFGIGMILYPFLFAVFPTSWYVEEPRYLYFLWPLVVLVVGGTLARFRRPALLTGTLVAIAAGSVVGTAVMIHRGEETQGKYLDFAPGDLGPLIRQLRADGTDRVFADYWIAYRLALATDERVIASPLQSVRYRPYEAKVEAAANPAYVFFPDTCFERLFTGYLTDGRHVPYTTKRVGLFSVVQPAEKVLPAEALVDWANAQTIRC